MRKLRLTLPFALIAFALIALACTTSTQVPTQTPLPSTATPLPTVEVPTPTPETPEPTETPVPTETPEPTEIPMSLSEEELGELQTQLNANIAKWQAAQLTSYEFHYQRTCFCLPDFRPLVNIAVNNGEIDSIISVENETPVTENLDHYQTIEGLFGMIQSAIDEKVASINVSYDPEFGYPTEVYIDYNAMMADEENGFVISKLIVPEPPFPPFGNGGMTDEEAETLQNELDANIVKWQTSGLSDYTFEFSVNCFCPEDIRAPVKIVVRDWNTIESITYVESGESVTKYLDIYMTVGGAFDFLQEAIDQRAASVTVSYHPEFGYPTSAFVDRSFMIADEERGFTIENVESIEPLTIEQQQLRLDDNRALWETNGYSYYEIELRRICFCPEDITSPVVVTVNEGVIESVVYAETGEPVGEAFRDLFPSVDGMFDIVQDAIDREAERISVTYDSQRGYPTNMGMDYSFMIADEELGFSVSNITPIGYADLQAELDASRDLWDSKGILDYTIELRRVCFCITDVTQPVIVSVKNGEIDSITYAESGLPVSEDFLDLFPSVEALFDTLQDAIDEGAVRINVSYDPDFGYPTSMYIDYDAMIADEELGFEVMSLEAPLTKVSLDGHWTGSILIGNEAIGIQVDFSNDESGPSATIDIPEQFVDGLALSNVTFDGTAIHFEISESQAIFDGKLQGDKIAGQFNQLGVSTTFELARAERPEETPVSIEPVPYDEEDVTFQNGDVTLAGTLTLPPGGGPHPAIIMITGSGSQDRNEELVGFKIFGVIADHLTRNGIAVLRYDDRGVGGSTGRVNQSTLEEFSGDALAAVDLLKERSDIDPNQIGVFGHSEGGIVGPLAASQSNDISFMVLMAGTGVPGDEILSEQLEVISRLNGLDEDEIQESLATQQLTLNAVRTGEGWDELRDTIRQQILDNIDNLPESQRATITDPDTFADAVTDQQIQTAQTPWFKSFVEHDPRLALETTTVPVLALFGELDVQVTVEQNRPAIENALEAAGNNDVTVEVFDDANHLFQSAITGNLTEYPTLDKAFVPGFLDTISVWLLERVNVAAN